MQLEIMDVGCGAVEVGRMAAAPFDAQPRCARVGKVDVDVRSLQVAVDAQPVDVDAVGQAAQGRDESGEVGRGYVAPGSNVEPHRMFAQGREHVGEALGGKRDVVDAQR